MNALTLFLTKTSLRTHGNKILNYDYVLMIIGISVSVAVLCTALNLFEGYEKSVKRILLETNAHILISSNNNVALTPRQASILENALSARKEISTSCPVYVNTAMLQSGKKIRSIMLKAYPDLSKAYWFTKYVVSGKQYSGSKSVTIGSILAKDLGIAVGDDIELLSTGTNRSLPIGLVSRRQSFIISGILKTGYYEADKSLILMQTEDAYQFYGESPNYTYVEAYLKGKFINRTNSVTATLNNLTGGDYRIKNWIEFHGSLFSLISIEKWLIFIVFSFLALIAALNCISTVSTSIVEREKEMAVLSALGLSSKSLAEYVFLKIIGVCLIAISIGIISGTVLSYLITQQGVYQLKGEVYFIDKITMHVTVWNYLTVFITTLLFISLCVHIPLKQVRQLSPVEILRGK